MRALHWFRNDLRLHDNTALLEGMSRCDEWLPVFVVDPKLSLSATANQRRGRFMFDCLAHLARDLEGRGVPLIVLTGEPEVVLPLLMNQAGAELLTFNQNPTPFAQARDQRVHQAVTRNGGEVITKQDHLVFGSSEIRTAAGGPYSVYTPYRRTWWRCWENAPRLPQPTGRLKPPIPGFTADTLPWPEKTGLQIENRYFPTGGEKAGKLRLANFLNLTVGNYAEDRDRPDLDGTSRLSPYLRFGAVSVRECVLRAKMASATNSELRDGVNKWLDELVWREFYSSILEEHPRVMKGNFRREYDTLEWNNDPELFAAWCEGRTGYPIVDAGMRQLRATGWMHNRVRMIVASFLTKDLLIDWRMGERFFFEHLIDGDPASNNGGWQWAASTGTDAQPYFRIFNPTLQGKRWDPDGVYIRKWIPELRNVPTREIHAPTHSPLLNTYPAPIVDHASQRIIALDRYKRARDIGVPT